MKVIDFLEDDNIEHREAEMLSIAFLIVESIAIHIQQAISDSFVKHSSLGNPMPEEVRQHADKIMIVVGNSRNYNDKIEAKNNILAAIGKAFDSLSSFTGTIYPTIYDSNNNKLNNIK